ncbi:MAG: Sjogren's syndrome/scleroderma autoantigen 1 family protein [Candidatus Marsarchaeota archaeon]
MINDQDIKRMADLLKSGATMLADTCPVCGSPLFKLRDGQVICPHCNRPVVYLRAGESEAAAMEPYILERARDVLLRKLSDLTALLETDPDNASSYIALMSQVLDDLKKIESLVSAGAKRGEPRVIGRETDCS